jgi:AraC family transcriptional regulator
MHHGCFTQQPCSASGRPNSPSEQRGDTKTSTEVAEILDEIRVEVDRSPEGARAAALRLVSLLTPRAAAVSAGSRGGLALWQKRKIDCYLRENLERPLQVKQLAQQVSLSVSHFCRAFKDSFGTTPHMHIIRLRLERAQQLMLETQEPLSDIALRCGLADQAHLSKLFRRWMGETPNAWRRRTFIDAQGGIRIRGSTESGAASPRLAA